jgi:hypothetical protein
MDRAEALRSIQYNLIKYIQNKVKVDFDNARQVPVSFTFAGKTRAIGEVLGRFRIQKEPSLNALQVHTKGKEIYFLYFQLCELNHTRPSTRNIGPCVFEF